ncbi:MAG: DUF116 domain-containing protein [Anaeromyxobacter sp.]
MTPAPGSLTVDASPYRLSPPGAEPGAFARDLQALADGVLAAAAPLAPTLELVDQAAPPLERLTAEERVVEALTLGVLWRAHGHRVHRPARLGARVLRVLRRRPAHRAPRAEPGAEELSALLSWLLSTGEYGEEVRRLERWELALGGDPGLAGAVLGEVLAFTAWFEEAAAAALGATTAGVEPFRRGRLPLVAAEDQVQCGRTRAEYHLSMVAAALLNRAWRAGFVTARRRVVLAPSCLRLLPEGRCQAVRVGPRLVCQECTPACALAEVAAVAEAAGAELITVEHGSDLDPVLARLPRDGGTGVVGLACVPSLLSGGFKVRAAGLAPQCVLLEASGCGRWLAGPQPTSLDLGALARVLDVRAEAARASARSAAAALPGTGRCPRSPLPAAAPGCPATSGR